MKKSHSTQWQRDGVRIARVLVGLGLAAFLGGAIAANAALLRGLPAAHTASAEAKSTVTSTEVTSHEAATRMHVRSTETSRRLTPAGRTSKYTGAPGGDGPSKSECTGKGGEWRCTTIATGSDPGPGDDLISCHCIRH